MAKPVSTSVFLLVLACLATALVGLIIAPFAGSLFAAAVIAVALHPMQDKLTRVLGDRPGIAAGLWTAIVTLIVLGPLAVLGIYGTEQLSDEINGIVRTVETSGVEGLLEKMPESLRPHARDAIERIPRAILPRRAAESVPTPTTPEAAPGVNLDFGLIAAWTAKSVGVATNLVVDLGVLVLALFFLLAQGARLVDWASSVVPLTEERTSELFGRFRDVTRAVFVATLGSALVQTLIATAGFLIAGLTWLPIAMLFTFVAALIPVVGGAIVVVIAGILTWIGGEMGYGIFLIVWGLLPVGMSDNLIKPMLTERSLRLPASIVFFAMFGGVAVFGPMGVVAGPLVLAFFTATLRLMREEGWINA